ncbi:hypothetical protein D7X74_07700 [Corallococcus sp. CA047B]|uniref:hypothetical protein n=1 Tax=Corallococcus sp. CA047B TaxID=2316729 RepID=UPI000EA38DAD|nr:hypothetical protein [Corallococcus sp. CA047B]RKH19165.1 hypothetical protein D7X74_07700 [Corallococcus sp. CA047B]
MKAGDWCITKDDENWMDAPAFATREEAIARAGELGLSPGEPFWLAVATTPASYLGADNVVDMLDQHAMDEGPEGGDGYVVSDQARRELEVLLDYWAHKHEVRPMWFDMDGTERLTVPA